MSEIEIKSQTSLRKSYWLNYAAKIISGLWAGFWIFFAVANIGSEGFSVTGLRIAVGFTLVFLISALIPWRWEMTGGIILLIEGLAIAVYYPLMVRDNFSLHTVIFLELTMALPPLLAGFMFVHHNKIRMRQFLDNSTE